MTVDGALNPPLGTPPTAAGGHDPHPMWLYDDGAEAVVLPGSSNPASFTRE